MWAKSLEAFLSLAAEQEPHAEMAGLGAAGEGCSSRSQADTVWKRSRDKLHLKELKKMAMLDEQWGCHLVSGLVTWRLSV